MRLASEFKAPRFLRFLRNITGPEKHPIARTQLLVIQAVGENPDVQLLFNDEDSRSERDALIAARDHEVNPRGKLNFHIEFIGLLARCTSGVLPGAEAIGRSILPLRDILSHLVQTNLPLVLRANYLHLLNEAYINAKRPMEKSNDLCVQHFSSPRA